MKSKSKIHNVLAKEIGIDRGVRQVNNLVRHVTMYNTKINVNKSMVDGRNGETLVRGDIMV